MCTSQCPDGPSALTSTVPLHWWVPSVRTEVVLTETVALVLDWSTICAVWKVIDLSPAWPLWKLSIAPELVPEGGIGQRPRRGVVVRRGQGIEGLDRRDGSAGGAARRG